MFRLLASGGRVLVSGPTDSGKSTFCLALANACAVRGQRCAVVDADTGQSEIGPPGVIGLAHLDGPAASFADLDTDGMYFIGGTSPVGLLLEMTAGVEALCRAGLAHQPHMTVIDMPGFTQGRLAATMIANIVSLSAPDYFVVLQSQDNMRDILSVVRGLRQPEVILLDPSGQARRRSPDERSARRRLKLAAYFAGAQVFEVDARACGFPRGGPFLAPALPLDQRLALESHLGVGVVYAEESMGRMLVVTDAEARPEVVRTLPQAMRGGAYTCVPESWFKNVMVGLADDCGKHHAAGILESINFRSEHLRICSPIKRPAVVRQVLLGTLRVGADGRELGSVAPGALYAAAGTRPARRR